MKCPICTKEMTIKSQDMSNDAQTGTHYDRVRYTCVADDTWITIEVPKSVSTKSSVA